MSSRTGSLSVSGKSPRLCDANTEAAFRTDTRFIDVWPPSFTNSTRSDASPARSGLMARREREPGVRKSTEHAGTSDVHNRTTTFYSCIFYAYYSLFGCASSSPLWQNCTTAAHSVNLIKANRHWETGQQCRVSAAGHSVALLHVEKDIILMYITRAEWILSALSARGGDSVKDAHAETGALSRGELSREKRATRESLPDVQPFRFRPDLQDR